MRSMKKLLGCLLAFMMLSTLGLTAFASAPSDWVEVKGTYAKPDNSQYNSAVLSLMYLDNDVVMFEFFTRQGSESEDQSRSFCLAGAFYLDDNGFGLYEHPKNDHLKLTFTLNKDIVTVKQQGKLPADVSGNYSFTDSHIEVTQEAAIEILEQLPTATTSLNHNNGEYKLTMSDEMVDGWFYDVKANFADTNALIAEFYIAADMSAVYRVDTDTPLLIWGSAQPMLEAAYSTDDESLYGTTEVENSNAESAAGETQSVQASYVSALPSNDSASVGSQLQTDVFVPGNLNYSMTIKTSDPSVATVNDKGEITGVANGEAMINGVITVDGAEKPFEFTVRIFEKTVKSSITNIMLYILAPVILIAITALAFIRIKRKKHKQ